MLSRAINDAELDKDTTKQVRKLVRLMDEKYGIITSLPIVSKESDNCSIIPGGKVVELYMLLPNCQRIPIYQDDTHTPRTSHYLS